MSKRRVHLARRRDRKRHRASPLEQHTRTFVRPAVQIERRGGFALEIAERSVLNIVDQPA